MGFVWVHAELFLHSVSSPFHAFATTDRCPRSRLLHAAAPQNTLYSRPARWQLPLGAGLARPTHLQPLRGGSAARGRAYTVESGREGCGGAVRGDGHARAL